MPSKDPKDGIRKYSRKPYCNVIKCLNPRSLNKTFTGLSIDISDSGMCLYTSDRLHRGEEILVQEKLPVGYRKANVVWIKSYHTGLHRVGLKFHE